MKSRRPGRRRRLCRYLWLGQRLRLNAISHGDIEPVFRHEHLYLATLRLRGRANPAEFLLPGPLIHAEAADLKRPPPP